MATNKRSKKIGLRRSLLFYSLMIAFPVIQFIVFYIGVNINSVLLAFKDIDPLNFNNYHWTTENFTRWFTDEVLWNELSAGFGVSIKAYFISLIVGVPLGLFFSYYIFKKMPGSNFFRVVLFLPSIISSIVLVTIYSYFTDYVVMDWLEKLGIHLKRTLMGSEDTRFGTMMVYNVFVSFGTSVLMYSNKMSGISPEIIESAHLDGAGALQEFFYIALPMSFSTISVFLITGIAGIFTNQINNHAFFAGAGAAPPDTQTIGFILFYRTQSAKQNMSEYPLIASLSVMLTLVVVPLTYIARYCFNRFGPSEN
ncbi:MAG: sugar ABC transporter permease [Clostridia bacterium]|nr:sugar ABC transporter permease [Clostridia bacterium]